jgi:hypothetical protein
MSSTKQLGVMQEMMNDLAQARRTPYGTPIPWSAEPVTKFGSLVAPAFGSANQGIILTYTTPQNFYSLICGIVLGWAGPGPLPLPGDLIFTVDIDVPLGIVGVGYPEKDYGSIQFPLGSFVPGQPWPVEFRHKNGEVLRIKGQTVVNVTTGPGDFMTAGLFGWQWPKEGWE